MTETTICQIQPRILTTNHTFLHTLVHTFLRKKKTLLSSALSFIIHRRTNGKDLEDSFHEFCDK